MQNLFFSHLPSDKQFVEVIEDLIADFDGDKRQIEANFDHIGDVWDADGKHLGKWYKVNEFMVDYIHAAAEAGGIGYMVEDYVGDAPIGHFDHLKD